MKIISKDCLSSSLPCLLLVALPLHCGCDSPHDSLGYVARNTLNSPISIMRGTLWHSINGVWRKKHFALVSFTQVWGFGCPNHFHVGMLCIHAGEGQKKWHKDLRVQSAPSWHKDLHAQSAPSWHPPLMPQQRST